MSMEFHEPERPISPSLIDTLHDPPSLRTRTAPASFADKVPYNVMERRGTANALVRPPAGCAPKDRLSRVHTPYCIFSAPTSASSGQIDRLVRPGWCGNDQDLAC